MYFEESDDYYILIESYGPTVYKLTRNYEWDVELIEGEDVYLGTLFSNYDIEDIISSLRDSYNVVELIDESDIDGYF